MVTIKRRQFGDLGEKAMAPKARSLVFFVQAALLLLSFSIPAKAKILFDLSNAEWTLETGGVEYILGKTDGLVSLKYFGPAGQPSWEPPAVTSGPPLAPGVRYEIAGSTEGKGIFPEDLELTGQETLHPAKGVDELRLIYKHRCLPLRVTVEYFTWGETGVFTRELTVLNQGDKTIHIEALPSLALDLPRGRYELTYLWGGWGHERQLATEPLAAGQRSLVSARGRSTNGYSPWFCLHSQDLGIRFFAQLAYSGNWQMSFDRAPDGR